MKRKTIWLLLLLFSSSSFGHGRPRYGPSANISDLIDIDSITLNDDAWIGDASDRTRLEMDLTADPNTWTIYDANFVINGGAIVVPVGSATNPSLTFAGDLNTGIYTAGLGRITFATNSTQRGEFTTVGLRVTTGTASQPGYSFLNDTDTGFNAASNILMFVTAGDEGMRLTDVNDLLLNTATDPTANGGGALVLGLVDANSVTAGANTALAYVDNLGATTYWHFMTEDDKEVRIGEGNVLLPDDAYTGIYNAERIIYDTAGIISVMGANLSIGTTENSADVDIRGGATSNIRLGGGGTNNQTTTLSFVEKASGATILGGGFLQFDGTANTFNIGGINSSGTLMPAIAFARDTGVPNFLTDVLINTTTVPTANGGGALVMGILDANSMTLGANTAGLFVQDVAASAELFAMDEADNETQLSPHDPITGEWIFYSRNIRTGREVRVNMEQLVAAVEELTGKQFLFDSYDAGRKMQN